MANFIDPNTHEIVDIFYFSAYASWIPGAAVRHEQFVRANEALGVKAIMSQFKPKDRRCKHCKAEWIAHEEKETDVKIAVSMVRNAHLNLFDEAFLVSRDSDLTSAVALTLHDFPEKKVKIISPPNSGHSKEIGKIVKKRGKLASIKEIHLERCLLPEIVSIDGVQVAVRPAQYAPPK